MAGRGADEKQVEEAVRFGQREEVRGGRKAFRRNFSYQSEWEGNWYNIKQVMPIVAEEEDELVVVTVYVFYIGVRT
jgi:hypothetical protein